MQLRAIKGLCSSVAWVHFSRVACALLVQLRTKNLPKDRLIRGGTVVPGRFVMSDSVTQYNSRLYTECIWVYALFMLFSDPWNFRESRCWLKKRPWCCAAWLLAISRTSSLSSGCLFLGGPPRDSSWKSYLEQMVGRWFEALKSWPVCNAGPTRADLGLP